jgi:hypothetical protein
MDKPSFSHRSGDELFLLLCDWLEMNEIEIDIFREASVNSHRFSSI